MRHFSVCGQIRSQCVACCFWTTLNFLRACLAELFFDFDQCSRVDGKSTFGSSGGGGLDFEAGSGGFRDREQDTESGGFGPESQANQKSGKLHEWHLIAIHWTQTRRIQSGFGQSYLKSLPLQPTHPPRSPSARHEKPHPASQTYGFQKNPAKKFSNPKIEFFKLPLSRIQQK